MEEIEAEEKKDLKQNQNENTYTMLSDIFLYNEDFEKNTRFIKINKENGDVYRGHIDDQNQPHNEGVMVYQDGSVYEGTWVNGVKKGKGFQRSKDGTNFKGNFDADEPNGIGTETRPDGMEISGAFVKGKL
jgi:hypothetical protein